ncbi:MAG: IclR family transcriptional regulator [Pseudomonadota bacterium]
MPTKGRAADTGTVSRAIAILREMAEAEGDVQIKTLAERLLLPPSTVHRLLELLAHEGMIEHDAAARAYRVGREFFRLSSLVFNKHPIQAVAMPILKAALQEYNETAYLGLYLPQEGKMMFVADCESSHPLGYRVKKNEPLSLLTGASGRSILAYLPKDAVERALAAEKDDPAVRRAVPSRRALHEALAQIRAQGFAVTFGQRIPGAVGIFAGVFDVHGKVVGNIGYTVPEHRYRKNLLPQLSGAVRKFAHTLSRTLGYKERMTAY